MTRTLYFKTLDMGRKLVRWTQGQVDYLLAHYKDESMFELGVRFGCSAPTVSKKLRSLGIDIGKGSKSMRRVWSDEEIEYVKAHFADESAVDIGEHLGISDVMVRKKALELGLKKSDGYDKKRYYYRYVKNYKHNVRRAAV